MNMQSKMPITAAEQALVDSFVSQSGGLPGDDATMAIRNDFIEEIKHAGLPTRRVETWHYTDLRNLLKSIPVRDGNEGAAPVVSLLASADVISVVDGHVLECVKTADIGFSPYRENLADGSAAKRMIARGSDDLIGQINGAFVADGANIALADGAKRDVPIEIQVSHGGGQCHTRFPVSIGTGASGLFIERHIATSDRGAFVSSITDLHVGEGADVVWVISQEQGLADTHFGQMNIVLEANAKLTLFVANSGGKLVRQEIHIAACGENSELALRGVNLLGGDSHTDVTMTLDHTVPNCSSEQIFRNVVFDRANGVFQGQIKVSRIAQKTDAKMACNTLLLSDDGNFSSKPELEIFADDVQCGHGATVTDIDDNHLFYLKARGIGEKRARGLLIKAFTAEIVEELDNDALIEALENRFEKWLDNHG